ncbi:Lysine--tRNA ligase [Candidatus Erwinia haradaeae]|uniref:Lysine--tRNA ligase n=1 Tax=Candidatus Erwinia haradaeae TaxID=1922217 RepID=A0A451CZA4_9GAMM|nr:lysine--tRNA ligase [Candidatus Erwinia haradaeae]VFP78763.1 Lysine--tRNA ligase [Candidatus Erwinia haradaeae]
MSNQKPLISQVKPNLSEDTKLRRTKLLSLKKTGIAFPNNFRRLHTSEELHAVFDKKNKTEIALLDIIVTVAGRIMTRRIMGKTSFVTIQDSGGYIQLYLSREFLPNEFYEKQFKKWDLGDIIGAKGTLFKTQTGELSIYCSELNLLTKAIRPLPDKFHGLTDQEACYRQRYLDLITNPDTRNIFKIRSRLIEGIRKFMISHNFLEVETPMMQMKPGGATARPFTTHHNALNLDMYLRISPELYLKRLVVGGFDRIFEINRSFRNEGLSSRHNPEFTMLELYMAYSDYQDLMKLIENLFYTLSKDVLGKTTILYGKHTLYFDKPFHKITMKQAIIKYHPQINIVNLNNFNQTLEITRSLGIAINPTWGLGRLINEIFEKTIEENLIEPTFITEYPTEVSPLARRNDLNPEITDRFELFISGREIGNGFSELNDSEDQKERFLQQLYNKDMEENTTEIFYDEDYITALEYGLPPTAGLGIGIDRLVMLFTNRHTIRDVILFPLLRPDIK